MTVQQVIEVCFMRLPHYVEKNPKMILFGLFSSPLILAYISQYGFGLEPCILCIYQRIPYAIMAALMAVLLMIRKPLTRWIWILLILGILAELVIAGYHVGVEQGIITEGVGCTEEVQATSIEQLRAQLFEKPNVACDKPQFEFIGLTMAAWNCVYAFALLIFMVFYSRALLHKRAKFNG